MHCAFARLGLGSESGTSVSRLVISSIAAYPRELKCLHVCGNSIQKGTATVLDAWRLSDLPPLEVYSYGDGARTLRGLHAAGGIPKNVRISLRSESASVIREASNRCLIHVYPSTVEGFGHSIAQALACGSVVVTTDAPPMCEYVASEYGVLVRPGRRLERGLYSISRVRPSELNAVLSKLSQQPSSRLFAMGKAARKAYERMREDFFERVRLAVKEDVRAGI